MKPGFPRAMNDDWYGTEHGTVVRSYFHAAGASRELRLAQEAGWSIREVKLNGEPVIENPPRKWWRLSPTRIVRDADGTIELRTGSPLRAVDWHPTDQKTATFDLEVTYARN
jgi:hypothetical protein